MFYLVAFIAVVFITSHANPNIRAGGWLIMVVVAPWWLSAFVGIAAGIAWLVRISTGGSIVDSGSFSTPRNYADEVAKGPAGQQSR